MRRFVPLALLLATTAACQVTDGTTTMDPSTTGETHPPGEQATIAFVFDGDSFEASVDGRVEEIRLLGINAPEEDECFGEQSRDALISAVDGQEVALVRGGSEDRDDFGRLLRYVYLDGRNINEAMLFHGHAVAVHGDHNLNDGFVFVMDDAALDELGMWSPNACGPATHRDVVIEWVEFNPRGPDDEVLGDEYVEIVNNGSLMVDLTGWTLRDESSQNRYRFDRVLRPGDRVLVRSGCGNDGGEDAFWCSDHSIWSNGGDNAILQDEHGNVVSWWSYRGG